jgi:Tol biopolymer transport system component
MPELIGPGVAAPARDSTVCDLEARQFRRGYHGAAPPRPTAKGGTVRVRLLASIVCLLVVLIPLAPATAGGASTQLVSQFGGVDAVHGSCSTFGSRAISGDGRFVVFTVDDDALPGADATRDVYIRDLVKSTTRLVSKNSAGAPADADSSDAIAISASGRFVAFSSVAENLPGGEGTEDVFLRDLETGTTVLISKTTAGDELDDDSNDPSVSPGGRFVAFRSSADVLPGDDSVSNVYVRDRKAKTTELVSKTSADVPANGDSDYPSVSGDGSRISFQSSANNLPGTDDLNRVFVHNTGTGATRLVSKTSSGAFLDAPSAATAGSMSGNGRYVAFESDASNLPGGTDTLDVYLHDVKTGITRLMSKTSAGVPGDSDSGAPVSVSSDGRYVAFESDADNLGGVPGFVDVFLHDNQGGDTRLISRATSGAIGKEDSFYAAVSANGRFVAFSSRSDNFSAVDDNDVTNCFVRGPLG